MDPHALTKLFRAFPEPGDPMLGQIKQKDIKTIKRHVIFQSRISENGFPRFDSVRASGPWPKAMGLGPMAMFRFVFLFVKRWKNMRFL